MGCWCHVNVLLVICWYVDNNKISHEDPKVMEEVIKKIEDKFGSMSKTEEEINCEIAWRRVNMYIDMWTW